MKHLSVIIIVCCLCSGGIAWGNDTKAYPIKSVAAETGEGVSASPPMYLDTRTGHKYIRMDENSYAEYSKRGKYLKTVPSNLPVLVNNTGIHPITESTYILYKKGGCGNKEYTLVSGRKNHPEGCQHVKVLVALD